MRNDLATFQHGCPLECVAELRNLVGEMDLMRLVLFIEGTFFVSALICKMEIIMLCVLAAKNEE